jgi:hypothetical protein
VDAGEPAREASALADELQDTNLRVFAFEARALAAFGEGDYRQALTWADRVTYLVQDVTDPDLEADAYAAAIPAAAVLGRFREATRLASVFRDLNEQLTPHHRVHGVAVPCEVAELRGDWQQILELEQAVVERVDANLDTPCVRNARTLLLCAVAREEAGDAEAARQLEARAQELWMHGHGLVLDAAVLKLALARGDLDTLERVCEGGLRLRRQTWFFVSTVIAQLDALAALRRAEEVEAVAREHSRPGTVLEPFALRALGLAKGDRALLEQALARFEGFRLDWHAERTRELIAQA